MTRLLVSMFVMLMPFVMVFGIIALTAIGPMTLSGTAFAVVMVVVAAVAMTIGATLGYAQAAIDGAKEARR